MNTRPDAGFDVYLIVDGTPGQVGCAQRVVRALRNPRLAVQLRMKGASRAELQPAVEALQQATREAGSPLLLNADSPAALDAARVLGVDGIQLPAAGPCPQEARALLSPVQRMGSSCHDAAEIARSEAGGADFVLLSPFGAVPGKGAALGAAAFARLAAGCVAPVVALGGIGPETAELALKSGAHALAVIRAVLGANDPIQAASRLLKQVQALREENPLQPD